MPRSLLNRCLPDSIREFRTAARQRFLDGVSAAASGRRTAAIYLWGYTAEMTLKAAYFTVIGFAETQVITSADLMAAINTGRWMGIAWPPRGQGHNLRAWAELLVLTRAATPGMAYATPGFGIEVQRRGQRLEHLWSETLRYHKNIAYLYEVRQVQEVAEWLLVHSLAL
jgi:hypothetical protein